MNLPGGLVENWTADPAVLLSCALGYALWLRGRRCLLRSRHVSLTRPSTAGVWMDRPWYRPAFIAALVSMLLAACSPLDTFSGELFWVHMVQHLILLMLVAPLLVLAAPWLPLWYGLPARARRAVAGGSGRLTRGATFMRGSRSWALCSLLAFVIGTWLWHWPALYDLALNNDVLHDYGEHNTFLALGILFWLQVLPSAPWHPALGIIGRAVFLLAAILQNVLLSVVLGFAPHPLYAPYAALTHRPGGISALTDQQLGAAIMWSIGDLPFVLGLVGLVQVWLRVQMAVAARNDDTIRTAAGEGSA